MMEEEKEYAELTANVLQKGKLFGIPYRNYIEAILGALLVFIIINLLPFTPLVTTISSIVLCISVIFFAIRGFKNRSITQIFFAEMRFRKRKRRLHLRTPEYKRRARLEGYNDESVFETIIRKAKSGYYEFIDTYRTK